MKPYTQLTQVQRYQINALLEIGQTQTEIAVVIGVHKSTISRELRRNRGKRGYRAKQAQEKAQRRRKVKSKRRITQSEWENVERLIREEWSPEQISARMKREKSLRISHEWIYQYIYRDKRKGGDLYTHLRIQKKRRKRYGSYDYRGRIPNRVSIEKRPEIVNKRERIGDWEVDTIVGKGHQMAIVSLLDRKSRYVRLSKVRRRSAELVGNAIVDMLKPSIYPCFTITADNGKEFAKHTSIASQLGTEFYFAHPYSSWERGSNENANGLVRQYIPKKRLFSSVTDGELSCIEKKLNFRPKKCLDYYTPFEVFFGVSVALTT